MALMLVARGLAVLVAVGLGACGASTTRSTMPDGPSWSLTEPRALGASPGSAGPTPAQPYEYRGGRDPVTGQARTREGPAVAAPPAKHAVPASPSSGQSRTLEVRKGDTLHGLSLQHHVSVTALMAANHLADSKIMPGQKLVLPPEPQ